MRGLLLGVAALPLIGTVVIGAGSASVHAQGVSAARDATQPNPRVVNGSGARVFRVNLPRDSPLVVGAGHSGSSNFAVTIVGNGNRELLINEIGRFGGEVAWADAESGRYRVAVEADGRWTLVFVQPTPRAGAKLLPGTISGHGHRVIQFRTKRDLEPVFTGSHRGQSNFAVHVIGIGSLSGSYLIFNEIGNYNGQELVDKMPRGPYLLAVVADGNWSIRVTP